MIKKDEKIGSISQFYEILFLLFNPLSDFDIIFRISKLKIDVFLEESCAKTIKDIVNFLHCLIENVGCSKKSPLSLSHWV